MDAKKYERSVPLLCPTCGNDQLETDSGDDTAEMITCPPCGRMMTRDELIRENSENISVHKDEMVREIKNDVTGEVQKMFKDAFRGNKNIKFK